MNRRSVLRWLGLAPVAAPAAVAAVSAPALPPVDYSGLSARISADTALSERIDGVMARAFEAEANLGLTHPFTFDGQTVRMPNAQLTTVEQRIAAAEGRIGHLVATSAG